MNPIKPILYITLILGLISGTKASSLCENSKELPIRYFTSVNMEYGEIENNENNNLIRERGIMIPEEIYNEVRLGNIKLHIESKPNSPISKKEAYSYYVATIPVDYTTLDYENFSLEIAKLIEFPTSWIELESASYNYPLDKIYCATHDFDYESSILLFFQYYKNAPLSTLHIGKLSNGFFKIIDYNSSTTLVIASLYKTNDDKYLEVTFAVDNEKITREKLIKYPWDNLGIGD